MNSLFHSEIPFHIRMASTAGTLILLLDESLDLVARDHPPVLVFRMLILGPAKSPLQQRHPSLRHESAIYV